MRRAGSATGSELSYDINLPGGERSRQHDAVEAISGPDQAIP